MFDKSRIEELAAQKIKNECIGCDLNFNKNLFDMNIYDIKQLIGVVISNYNDVFPTSEDTAVLTVQVEEACKYLQLPISAQKFINSVLFFL